jgi:hypothetical protein
VNFKYCATPRRGFFWETSKENFDAKGEFLEGVEAALARLFSRTASGKALRSDVKGCM